MWCLRASHCAPQAVNTSVYDNNCPPAQTATSCAVWPFAPEASGAEPFPAPVRLAPASRPWLAPSLCTSPRSLHSEGEQEEAWLTEAGLAQMVDNSLAPNVEEVTDICPRVMSPNESGSLECSNGCVFFSCGADGQEEDNRVFLSTLTRTQAAAVERRMASFQQTLRRRNRQHVPDVRDIFRAPDKVHAGTYRKIRPISYHV